MKAFKILDRGLCNTSPVFRDGAPVIVLLQYRWDAVRK
jgi:hypothetical protein